MKKWILITFLSIFSINFIYGQKEFHLHYYTDTSFLSESKPFSFDLKDTLPDGKYYVFYNKSKVGKLSKIRIYAEYRNMVRNGLYIEYQQHYIYQSRYVNGKLEGQYYQYCLREKDTIVLQKGNYSNDKKVGEWITFYENSGRVSKIENYNEYGELNGPQVTINNDGTEVKVINYRAGKIEK
jgi:hypothetical protein